jgi:hypothetical protein
MPALQAAAIQAHFAKYPPARLKRQPPEFRQHGVKLISQTSARKSDMFD